MGTGREEEVKGGPEYKIPQDILDGIKKKSYAFVNVVMKAQEKLKVYGDKKIREVRGDGYRSKLGKYTKPERIEAYKKFKNSLDSARAEGNIATFTGLYNSAVNPRPRGDTEESKKAWEAKNFCTYVPGIKEQLGKEELYGCVKEIANIFIARIQFFEKFKDDANLVLHILKNEDLRKWLGADDIGEILKPWFDLEKRNTDEDREHRKQFRQILEKIDFGKTKIIIPGFYQNRTLDSVSLGELIDLLPGEAKVDISEESIRSFAENIFKVPENVLNPTDFNAEIGKKIDDHIRLLTNDRMETALKDYLSKVPIKYLHAFLSGSEQARIKIAREYINEICDQPAFSDVQRSDHVKNVLKTYDPEKVRKLAAEIVTPYTQLLDKLSGLYEKYNEVFDAYSRISDGCGEKAYREQFEERNKAIGRKIESLASKNPTEETKNEIKLCEQALIENFNGFINFMFTIFSEASETTALYGFIPRLRLMLYQTFAVTDVSVTGPFFDSNAIKEINAGLVVEYARWMRDPREYPFFNGRDDGADLPQKYSFRMPCFVSEAKDERPFANPDKPEHITPRSLTQFAARWKKACEVKKIREPLALQRLIQAINDIKIAVKDDDHLPTGWCDAHIKPILNSIATHEEAKNDSKGLTEQYVNRLEKGTVRAGEYEIVGLSLPTQYMIHSINFVKELTVDPYDLGIGRLNFFHKKSAGVEKIRLALEVITKRHDNNGDAILNSDDVELLRDVFKALDADKTISSEKTPGTFLAKSRLGECLAKYEPVSRNDSRLSFSEEKEERASTSRSHSRTSTSSRRGSS